MRSHACERLSIPNSDSAVASFWLPAVNRSDREASSDAVELP